MCNRREGACSTNGCKSNRRDSGGDPISYCSNGSLVQQEGKLGLLREYAIDSVGGSEGNDLAFCVHPNGSFLTIGLLSGIQVNWTEIINKAKVNAIMFHLRNWNKNVSIDKWQETFHHLITLVNNNRLYV